MKDVSVKSVRFSTLVYCILSFSIVIITAGDAALPLGFFAAGALLDVTVHPSMALLLAPIVVLFVSVLLSSIRWRSALFIVGSMMLTAEWLLITFTSSHLWVSVMTSLPYIAIVSYWTAISLNTLLRRQEHDALVS